MCFYGENLILNIFGSSHGPEIGMCLSGIPRGESIDTEELQRFLSRRSPGNSELSSSRREPDRAEFLSGIVNGKTDGGIIRAVIKNTDCRSSDYAALEHIPRPGHADLTARLKYGGSADMRGGGPFSGRMTAPLCIAGGICAQLLSREGTEIISRIYSIGGIQDEGELKESLAAKAFPVNCEAQGEKMRELILRLRSQGDSVGGVIECAVLKPPPALGGPLFQGLEGRLASAAFAIPGVKGIDFGAGIAAASMKGSENNDAFAVRDGKIITLSNNCGGILGGISDGMPISFRLYIKPTPSIAKEQQSVRLDTLEELKISVPGRHDPCIVPRALPCAESAAALVLYDALLTRRKENQHGA